MNTRNNPDGRGTKFPCCSEFWYAECECAWEKVPRNKYMSESARHSLHILVQCRTQPDFHHTFWSDVGVSPTFATYSDSMSESARHSLHILIQCRSQSDIRYTFWSNVRLSPTFATHSGPMWLSPTFATRSGPMSERPDQEADHSPTSTAEVRNALCFTSILPFTFMEHKRWPGIHCVCA